MFDDDELEIVSSAFAGMVVAPKLLKAANEEGRRPGREALGDTLLNRMGQSPNKYLMYGGIGGGALGAATGGLHSYLTGRDASTSLRRALVGGGLGAGAGAAISQVPRWMLEMEGYDPETGTMPVPGETKVDPERYNIYNPLKAALTWGGLGAAGQTALHAKRRHRASGERSRAAEREAAGLIRKPGIQSHEARDVVQDMSRKVHHEGRDSIHARKRLIRGYEEIARAAEVQLQQAVDKATLALDNANQAHSNTARRMASTDAERATTLKRVQDAEAALADAANKQQSLKAQNLATAKKMEATPKDLKKFTRPGKKGKRTARPPAKGMWGKTKRMFGTAGDMVRHGGKRLRADTGRRIIQKQRPDKVGNPLATILLALAGGGIGAHSEYVREKRSE